MDWSTKRKIVYACAVIIAISGAGIFATKDILFPKPTCFDTKKNGFESGIDCGGACRLVCKADVSPFVVTWSKAIQVEKGVYDFVGMVRNSNINNASQVVGYTFQAYSRGETPIATISGSTTVPLDGLFPIIVQNTKLAESPQTVTLTLFDGDHYTVEENPISPTVRIGDRRYEAGDVSRVYATIINTKRMDINNLPVRVVLFDQYDNAYATGETYIEKLLKEESKEIVITWRNILSFPPTKIGIYPIFNPFSVRNN